MYKKCTLVKIKNAKKMQKVYAFPVVFYMNIYKNLQTERYKKDTLGKNQNDSNICKKVQKCTLGKKEQKRTENIISVVGVER